MSVEIGQKVTKRPSWGIGETKNGEKAQPITGFVRYIHPKGRYYVVEFPMRNGRIRECFYDR